MNPVDQVETTDVFDASTGKKMNIIDCDVHPRMPKGVQSLKPYLPEKWQARLGMKGALVKDEANPRNTFAVPRRAFFHPHPGGSGRVDARPPEGGPIGSSINFLRSQLLDEHDMNYAIIVGQDATGVSGIPDADLSAAYASAYNDFVLAEWASTDHRLKACIWVSPRDPQLAADEIDRLADHPDIVSVQICPMDIPLGKRYMWPIYEAASRHNLPVAIHGGAETSGVNPPMLAVGMPSYFIELHSGLPQVGWMHVTSMVCEGVFERFPNLKFIVQEMGYAWVVGLMWRLDKEWRSLRLEVPWVKKPPSEIIRKNVRFTSQPVEEPPKPEFNEQMLKMIYAEDTLQFSSDYPHWDFDDPRYVFPNIDPELRKSIFYKNALDTYPKIKKLVVGENGVT